MWRALVLISVPSGRLKFFLMMASASGAVRALTTQGTAYRAPGSVMLTTTPFLKGQSATSVSSVMP